ncbi:MAG: hypothetical protein A2Z20_05720 [Bdellovibrionales bacterium RBG_16_40_8]|nr:MAG: hypothetical protein A2Z20_05720 [Bdellovibrionales bacterium RBG_16_40_8]
MNLRQPVPVIVENGPDKISGFVMKLTARGLLVEVDNIPFKVGTYLNLTIQLNEKTVIVQRARSIKHYDQFFRKPVQKKLKEGEAPPSPKKLCELHFHSLTEQNQVTISKFLLYLRTQNA